MELEELHVLSDDVCGRAVLLIAPKLIVDLHDVGQFVCQVILRQEVRSITIQPTLSAQSACANTWCLSPSRHTSLGGSAGLSVHRSRSTFVSSNLLKGLTQPASGRVPSGPGDPSITLACLRPRHRPPSARTPGLAERQGPAGTDLVAGRALHHNSRPHGERGHGQHSDNHPLRPGVARLHAQDEALLI